VLRNKNVIPGGGSAQAGTQPPGGSNGGAIAGAVIGSVVLVAAIAAVVWFMYRDRWPTDPESNSPEIDEYLF
jgi:uncharacterized membrane-anchored protein